MLCYIFAKMKYTMNFAEHLNRSWVAEFETFWLYVYFKSKVDGNCTTLDELRLNF